jgi:hypothetical protein
VVVVEVVVVVIGSGEVRSLVVTDRLGALGALLPAELNATTLNV